MKLVYNEWYGEISVAQQRAYKKFNVSQSDHDDLVEHAGGADKHDEIVDLVKRYSWRQGMFSTFDMIRKDAGPV